MSIFMENPVVVNFFFITRVALHVPGDKMGRPSLLEFPIGGFVKSHRVGESSSILGKELLLNQSFVDTRSVHSGQISALESSDCYAGSEYR